MLLNAHTKHKSLIINSVYVNKLLNSTFDCAGAGAGGRVMRCVYVCVYTHIIMSLISIISFNATNYNTLL